MAFPAVDIPPSPRQARASRSCAVKVENGRFHKVSWRSERFGAPCPRESNVWGASDHVRPKSRNRLAVKLGALEISSDVWIVARGKAELRALSEDLTR
jgi:hypothetical protein